MEKVSVIIPVYNVEKYLRQCVDSVISQSYKDLEIILIDDGSPDKCPEICDEYTAQDKRIKVIHKKNGGLSSARNAGLDICTGDYVFFIDSDDYVHVSIVEKLLNLIQAYKADIAICGMNTFIDSKNCKFILSEKDNVICLTAHEATEMMFYQDGFDVSACAKLFKRCACDNILFTPGVIYEDLFPISKAMLQAATVVLDDAKLYAYRMRAASISKQVYTPCEMDCIDQADELYAYVTQNYPELIKAVSCRVLCAYFQVLSKFSANQYYEHYEEINRIWQNIKRMRKIVLIDRKARKRARIAAALSYTGKSATFFIWHRILIAIKKSEGKHFSQFAVY